MEDVKTHFGKAVFFVGLGCLDEVVARELEKRHAETHRVDRRFFDEQLRAMISYQVKNVRYIKDRFADGCQPSDPPLHDLRWRDILVRQRKQIKLGFVSDVFEQ